MTYQIKLDVSGPPYGLRRRVFNGFKKHAFFKAGVFWHRLLRPKHFTNRGATEYGYTPREGERGSGRRFKNSYTAAKLKARGHTRPLVWSGQSLALSQQRRIYATSKGVRVTMPVRAFNFRPKNSNVDMAREFTAHTPAERELITKRFVAALSRQIRRATGRKTINI